ncbi:MAG: indole-3-glycerol phosphate synthase TrpC [bacterium]
MILDKIIKHKIIEVCKQKETISLDEIKQNLNANHSLRRFKEAISVPNRINLIAEIKKASPSRGIIRKDFDPASIAVAYEDNGASAVSVLTDKEFFQGDLKILSIVRSVTSLLPILRKDFIIDDYQIYQSKVAGADAILLISAILDLNTLQKFLDVATEIGLDCLVEVHTEDELRKVLKTSASIIGINNRNLHTFEVDIKTTAELVKMIPKDKIIVSESGIFSNDDVVFLKNNGVHAILVGESLMASDDIPSKMRELLD